MREEIATAVRAAAANAGVKLTTTEFVAIVSSIEREQALIKAARRFAEKMKEHSAKKAD